MFLAHPAHVLATSTGGLGRTPVLHVRAFSALAAIVSANAGAGALDLACDGSFVGVRSVLPGAFAGVVGSNHSLSLTKY